MAMDGQAGLSFTEFVDVSGDGELFEFLDNRRVLELSQLGTGQPFSSVKSISRSTGVERRRILRPGKTALDVAVAAAEKLQQRVGFSWRDTPAVGLSHSHLDGKAAPSLAGKLARHLGIEERRFFLLNHGCVGFLELLCRAARRLREIPAGTHVPLLLVETPEQWHDASDRSFSGIVAAGGSGTTLWKGPGHRLLYVKTEPVRVSGNGRSNGRPLFAAERRPGFDFRGGACNRPVMTMDAEAVFTNGVELMLEAALESHRAAGPDGRRVIVVPHQASGKMVRALIAVGRQSLPSVEFLTYLRHQGNTISCTIPTVLARIDEATTDGGIAPAERGDVLLLVSAGICFARPADHLEKGHAAILWQPGAYRA